MTAAVQAYNDAHAQLRTQVTLAEGQTQHRYAAAVESEEVALAKEAESARQLIYHLANLSRARLVERAALSADQVRTIVLEAEQALRADLADAIRMAATVGFWRRYVIPNGASLRRLAREQVAHARLTRYQEMAAKLLGCASWSAMMRLLEEDECPDLEAGRVHVLLQLILSFGLGESQSLEYLAFVRQVARDEYDRAAAEVEAERLQLVGHRGEAAERLRLLRERLVGEARTRLGPLAELLRTAESALRREMGRHGLAFG